MIKISYSNGEHKVNTLMIAGSSTSNQRPSIVGFIIESQKVLVMPHRFLLDSGDSGRLQWIPEECKLAGGPANIAIPAIAHSSGIKAFRN